MQAGKDLRKELFMEKRKHSGGWALVPLLFLLGAATLSAQEPGGLSLSGGVHTGVRFTTNQVTTSLNGIVPDANLFEHYIYDFGPVNFLNLSGSYDGGNYYAQFGLGYTPGLNALGLNEDQSVINNAFAGVYALDRKLHIRAGKVEEFNWSNYNAWSPNYRRLSWAVGYTVVEGLTLNVYGDIPSANSAAVSTTYTPEAYAKNIDAAAYYTSAPFDFFAVFDNYSDASGASGDHTDVFFQFSLKAVPDLTFIVESKFQNLNNTTALPFSNITDITLGYKISDKLSVNSYITLGNGDFTTFYSTGTKAIDEDMDFTFTVNPWVTYALSDILSLSFEADFALPHVDDFGNFNLYFMPWLQWTIAPGAFFPNAYLQFYYRFDVYNDAATKSKNNGDSFAHMVAVELSVSF
jgi:hypothetical protein